MADELEFLYMKYGVRHFWFADDAMTINRDATLALCDEILRRNLKIAFFVTTRTDCVDEALLKKLKDAGCYEISFGIETGSPLLLEKMGKENDIETSEKAIYLAKKVGIKVTALIIIGNIGESEKTVEDTINFLRRTNPNSIGTVGGLWVLPGTKVYRECQKRGFIDDDFWLTDEPYKVYTVDLSLDELKKLQKKVLNYSWMEFLRRLKRLLSRGPRHIVHRLLELR
jgi:anaerobic magnesium-protoporphyrin IX monomethyl ester cyclase